MSRPAPRARRGGVDRVEVDARAKLNLGLAVGPRRADGYHELATVFQSISLSDTLIATRRRSGFTLTVRHEDASANRRGRARPRFVPGGRRNLVLEAAHRFAARFGVRAGASFRLIKRIPSRAGLGGGSADAAATLVALARLHGVRARRSDLLELALALGSDVPFALTGGTAAGFGRGERLVPARLARPFRALVAMPPWHVDTAQAFRRMDRRKFALTGWARNRKFLQALCRRPLSPSRALRLGNAFEDVLGPHRARYDSLAERLVEAGASHPHLTGSGSAVFGLVAPRAIGRRIIGRFSGREPLYLVRSVRAGLRIAMPR